MSLCKATPLTYSMAPIRPTQSGHAAYVRLELIWTGFAGRILAIEWLA